MEHCRSLIRDKFDAAILVAMESACARPSQWGWDDCGCWCASIIEKVLGYDLAEAYRAEYNTRTGARDILGRRGLRGLLQTIAKERGWVKIKPDEAQTGDIALTLTRGADGKFAATCFICRAPGWFVARGEVGFTALSANHMRVAWRVVS